MITHRVSRERAPRMASDPQPEHGLMAEHFAATAVRFKASEGPVLILQDTTEFIPAASRPARILRSCELAGLVCTTKMSR